MQGCRTGLGSGSATVRHSVLPSAELKHALGYSCGPRDEVFAALFADF